MAPTPGNAWTLSTGIQSALGTPNVVGHMKQRYTGGGGPKGTRNMLTLAETDASRISADPVVVGLRAEGDSEHYLRPDEFHRDAHLLLGQTSSTGATNYVHTATPTASGSAAFATLIRALGGTTLVDQIVDCQIASMTIRGGAEQAITYTKTWLGLTPTFGATDTALAASSSSPYVYPEVTVTKNSVTTDIVQSFELTINQNRTLIVGDNGLAASATVAGLLEVTGSMSILFQSDADWRAFQTGSTSGTTPGTTLFVQPLTILMQRDVNTSVSLQMVNVIITAYDPPMNTDGAPISVGMDFRSQRTATLGNYITIVTKNQIATVLT
jgi:hypothetical protein